jgi:soluble epoxide hydrolase/lipid-phosphate phosphatase
MNPADPTSFTSKHLKLSTGRTYHYIDQVPATYDPQTSTTILCIHGFPDFWYGWRYQIPHWVRAGHRVIAPDMLGYGGTDKPFDTLEYTTKKLCADLVALLDESTSGASVTNAPANVIVVGHDWGSFTAGRFALWHPDRLKGLALLSVPYTPPSPVYIPIEQVVQIAPNLEYQAYFARQEATKDLDLNVPRVVQLLYARIKNPEDKPKKSLLGDIKNHLTGNTDLSVLSSVLNDDVS